MNDMIRHIGVATGCFWLLASCASGPTAISRSLPNDVSSSSGATTLPIGLPKATAPAATAGPTTAPLFDWPIDEARMTRGFLPLRRRPHLGIDLASAKGTNIMASRAGTVIYRGRDFRGYGKMVMIESDDGWATLYAHLDSYSVEEGQKVRMGEMIASMGNTGRSTGPHLHFEIRRNRDPIDPLPYLPAGRELARSVSKR